MSAFSFRAGTSPAGPLRGDPGSVQRLADIDVAEPGDDALVEKQALDRRPAARRERARQIGGVEPAAERLGAEALEPGMLIQRVGGDEVHVAEAARVVEGDQRAGLGLEHDMGVLRIRRLREVEVARPSRRACAGDLEAAAHAQVHHQGLAAVERRQQVLRAPFQSLDARAGQPLDETLGQRKAQVRAARLDAGQPRAGQDGLKAPAHGLDLGKLGHGAMHSAPRSLNEIPPCQQCAPGRSRWRRRGFDA